jgi:hypothetical protein
MESTPISPRIPLVYSSKTGYIERRKHMADRAMDLRAEQLEQIGLYVRGNLGSWIREVTLDRDIEFRERFIRIEEELKTQRDLMREGFAHMEKRLEQVDKRFEQVDKRFESMQHNMDKRVEQSDKRIESLQHNMDRRFDDMQRSIRNGQWFIGLLVTFVMAASTAVQVLL